jgi:heat shock protein HslJ
MKLLTFLFSLILFIGCAPASSKKPIAAPQVSVSTLANTQWKLKSFTAQGAEIPVEGISITLRIGEDNRAAGSGGCNSYAGEYEARDDVISFSKIISTKKACVERSMMEQEQRYFNALGSAAAFKLSENTLTISYDGGQSMLNFVKA